LITTGGVPRTKPYVRKAGASPSASAKWTPCPSGQTEQEKAQANPAVPTHADEEESQDEAAPLTPAATSSSSANENAAGGNGGVFGSGPTGNANKAVDAAPSSTQEWSTTEVKTSFVDITSTHTWTPEASSSSSSSSSAAASSSAKEEGVWVAPAAKVAIKAPQQNNANGNGNGNGNNGNGNGNGNNGGEASSSSSSAAAPAYTPPVVVPSGGNKLGVAWDWRNPKGVLNQWSGAKYVYSGSFPATT